MQLEVKTILNRIQHFAGFVYREVCFGYSARGRLRIHVCLEPHRSSRGSCSACRKPAPGYDRLPQRSWLFVPLWGIKTYFLRATASELSGARCGGRAYSLERWQAAGHPHHDVLSVPLGAAAVVARDGAGLSNQLGMRLSLGGVVCSMGLGASEAGKRSLSRRGRDSLGQEQAGGQFPDGGLPD